MAPLNVLLVEDSDSDAELILRSLKKTGVEVAHARVETEDQLRAALREREWNLVLSDYNLPGFSASGALAVMHELGLDLPFIVVSGNVGEEMAVALMRAGAHDYVMKGNLARLAPAVKREIGEAARRREHRRAAEALRESEERWNFALEGAGYGVWDWDIAAGSVVCSPCWRAMHGYDEGEFDQSIAALERLIHPDDLAHSRAAMRAYLAGATQRFQNEYRALCKDGRWLWVLDHGMIVSRDADGKPLRMISTHADISERKQAEEALRELNVQLEARVEERERAEEALRELNEQLEARVEERTGELRRAMAQIVESEKLASLGALVAGVAHELSTPIGNMVLAATSLNEKLTELGGLAAQGGLTRSGLAQALADCCEASLIVERNGNRSNELIDSFKRVAVDQTSQRRRRFDLRATVQDSLTAMGAITRRAKVTVQLEIPQAIEMDSFPGHLEQIVNNLVMNSIIHGFEERAGGRIEIGAACVDGMVELVYRDNGHGIAPQLQHKVFEPFYTTKLGQGGSGLGLAIVHNLVQAIFKGRLRLDSAPGEGVCLSFSLPMVTPQ